MTVPTTDGRVAVGVHRESVSALTQQFGADPGRLAALAALSVAVDGVRRLLHASCTVLVGGTALDTGRTDAVATLRMGIVIPTAELDRALVDDQTFSLMTCDKVLTTDPRGVDRLIRRLRPVGGLIDAEVGPTGARAMMVEWASRPTDQWAEEIASPEAGVVEVT